MTLQATLIPPADLTPADQGAWTAFQAAQPALGTPLLGPEFAAAVGRVRSDAAIAVLRRAGRTIGFLAHHRRPGGFGRPIGAIWSDVHALIAEPGAVIDGAQALAAAGLSTFRVHGLLDPSGAFDEASTEAADSYSVQLAGDAAAYWESRRALSPKRFKNLRRLEHKLEREVGEIGFLAPDRAPASLEQLFRWKREQFRRTGRHDVLASGWSESLMRGLFAQQDGPFAGLLLTLTIDGRPVAGHFGVRQGEIYHPWIAAFDPAIAAYSPGWTFMRRAIEAMPGLGLSRYDLAGGHEHYKLPLASERTTIRIGGLHAAAPPASLDAAIAFAGRALGQARAPLVDRVRRRLDHIAAAEPSLSGRLQGLATALSGAGRQASDEAEA